MSAKTCIKLFLFHCRIIALWMRLVEHAADVLEIVPSSMDVKCTSIYHTG